MTTVSLVLALLRRLWGRGNPLRLSDGMEIVRDKGERRSSRDQDVFSAFGMKEQQDQATQGNT